MKIKVCRLPPDKSKGNVVLSKDYCAFRKPCKSGIRCDAPMFGCKYEEEIEATNCDSCDGRFVCFTASREK